MTACAAAPAQAAYPWPHGERAAVSLSYDDALDSQLDNAIPVLNRHGLRGSFFLQLSSPAVGKRMAQWRAAAKRGHELGNHTLFHQCSKLVDGHEWVQSHRNLDTMSVAQMKDQVLLANTMLQAIDGKRERTMTVPCGDITAQDGDYLASVAGEFVAIRYGHPSTMDRPMREVDPYAMPGHVPVNLSGLQLIALVKQAGERGAMLNLTFHGIGGDHLAVSSEAHEELVRYLAANRKVYWTDTFLNVMKHVKKTNAQLNAQ